MKIPNGPYTAWGLFILKCQEIKRYQVKSRVDNTLLNKTGETDRRLQPKLPLLNANCYFAGNNFLKVIE